MVDSNESTRSDLKQVTRLLQREEVPAAMAQIDLISTQAFGPEVGFQIKLLRAQGYLLERRFGPLRSCLLDLREDPQVRKYKNEVDTLDAHCLALIGQARQAFRLIAPVIRACETFTENHARAAHISGICLFRTGHYRWARKQLERSVAYYRLSKDDINLSLSLNTLALIEKSLGRLGAALDLFDESARLVPVEQYPRHHRRLLSNRGVCLLKLGRPRDAQVCFLEAKSLAVRSRDMSAGVALNNNLGHCHRILGDHERALGYYTQALQDAREASSLRQECLSLEFLGELLAEGGRLGEAEEYLGRAWELAAKLAPQGDLMMEVLRRRGEMHAAIGRKAEAEADLERAMQLCGARGEERERVLAQRALLLLRADKGTLGAGIQSILSSLKNLGDQFEFVRTIYVVLKNGHGELLQQDWFQEAITIATYYADVLDVEPWRKRLREVVGYARSVVSRRPALRGLHGELLISTRSRSFAKCLEAVGLAARSDCTVLIAGETGTGKEVIARLVHEQSGRAAGPLVAINCGALPENLVESELFGHVRGTFTGAHRDKEGLFEAAAGGTVLLDEIGDLPAHTQVKLLRFLDSCEYRRVGETRTRKANVRVLAATNRDLRSLVEARKFREDLLFRLNVFQVDVPPLRSRKDDILPLAEFFMKLACRPGMGLEFSDEVKACLETYEWSGNIREMKNVCQYLAAKAWGRSRIVLEDLPDGMRPLGSGRSETLPRFERERRDLERDQIAEALRRSDGKILRAAKLLGMGRNRLALRMKELGIEREAFRH